MGKQLYVTNIPFEASEEELRRLFAVAGRVKSIKMLTDPKSGRFRGVAFVEMATAAEARDAVESLDEALFNDRLIAVAEARPYQPKEGVPGGGEKRGARGGTRHGGRH